MKCKDAWDEDLNAKFMDREELKTSVTYVIGGMKKLRFEIPQIIFLRLTADI